MTEVAWLAIAVVLVIFLVSCIVVLAVRQGTLNASTLQIIANVSASSGAAVAAAAMIFAVAEGPSLSLSIPALLPPRATTAPPASRQIAEPPKATMAAPAPRQVVNGITVPDLVGVPLDKAKQSLAKLGLNWDVYMLPDSGFPDNVVVATKPFAGGVAKRDDLVKLRYSCSGTRFTCSENNGDMRFISVIFSAIAIALFYLRIRGAVRSSARDRRAGGISTVRFFVAMTATPAVFVCVIWLIWAVMYTHETF
ncbi:MAG: PASTA domain-containing protein [Sciscionella sp.]